MSNNIANLAAYQAYVQKHSATILHKIRIGFESASVVGLMPGIIGKETLTGTHITDIVKRYDEAFTPTVDAVTHSVRVLEVEDIKIDLKFVPQRYRRQYHGDLMRSKRTADDWPFFAWLTDMIIIPKIMEQKEIALWQGVKAAVPAATDLLIAVVDGFHKVIFDEVALGNITDVATGVLTNTNSVSAVEACYQELGSQYQAAGVDIIMSIKDRAKLIQDYRERYGKYHTDDQNRIQLDIANGNSTFHFLPGVKQNTIWMGEANNLKYGFDDVQDISALNLEVVDRSLKVFSDGTFGTQIAFITPDNMVVNDQH